VFVDTTVRSRFCTAHFTAGIRYAMLFPVPVPASATSTPPPLYAPAISRAMSRCVDRSSY
jgi:hypothetical protein